MSSYKFLLLVLLIMGGVRKSASPQPGNVIPGAKVLDANVLGPFNKGAAVVQKGSAYGLIDPSGNFIVPYGKYQSIVPVLTKSTISASASGIFLVTKPNGAINSAGKFITEEFPNSLWMQASEDGTLIKFPNGDQVTYLDAEGHKYVTKEVLEKIVDGLGIVRDIMNSKLGFKNLKGEWVVKPAYDLASPFSEGLACVGKIDEFGETKYGFIDKSGTVVIDLKYSKKPEDFHGGIARVVPKDVSEFKQAYIDKKGNIVKKLTTSDYYGYVGNGLYMEVLKHQHIMDSTGKMMTNDEFLKGFNLSSQSDDKPLNISIELAEGTPGIEDGRIGFLRYRGSVALPFLGCINIKTKTVLQGIFKGTRPLQFFDPISKLAVANFYLEEEKKYKSPVREGYINEQGLFVLVKAEASKW